MDLLDFLRTHLAAFDLPHLWSVHVVASFTGPNLTMQLARREPPRTADALLPGPTPSPTSPPKPGGDA
jgi:hypothetical protein